MRNGKYVSVNLDQFQAGHQDSNLPPGTDSLVATPSYFYTKVEEVLPNKDTYKRFVFRVKWELPVNEEGMVTGREGFTPIKSNDAEEFEEFLNEGTPP